MGTEPILVNAEAIGGDLGSKGVIVRPSFQEQTIQCPPIQSVCHGCAGYHGSVGQELQCLRREIRFLRDKFKKEAK
jgi:hypothetical protein